MSDYRKLWDDLRVIANRKNDELVQQAAVIERLKEFNQITVNGMAVLEQANAALRARVEELSKDAESYRMDARDLAKERDTLKERVQELEKENTGLKCLGYTDIYATLEQERDELRAQLEGESAALKATQALLRDTNAKVATFAGHAADCAETIAHLELQLAELQPKAPTVIKQTWQRIHANGEAPIHNHRRESTWGLLNIIANGTFLGWLRRDHWSTGEVTCELEPV